MDKRNMTIIACATVLTGLAAYSIYCLARKRKEKETDLWELYIESREKNREGIDETDEEDGDLENDEEDNIEEEEKEETISEPPVTYKKISDDKPDISEVMKRLTKASEKISKKEEEKHMDETLFNQSEVKFGDDGLPIFSEEDWTSEDDNILLISQSEYLNSCLDHEKEQAVWFSKSKVLVNTELSTLDIVDSVGPTAFTTLMRNPNLTIFVRNEDLKTDYELLTNNDITIEEAWEDQGVI